MNDTRVTDDLSPGPCFFNVTEERNRPRELQTTRKLITTPAKEPHNPSFIRRYT